MDLCAEAVRKSAWRSFIFRGMTPAVYAAFTM